MGGEGVTGVYGSDAWEGRVSLVCTVVMHGRGVVACVACHWREASSACRRDQSVHQ